MEDEKKTKTDNDDYYHDCSKADDSHVLADEPPKCPKCNSNENVSDKGDDFYCRKCRHPFY